MPIPQKKEIKYEQVKVDEFVTGQIVEVGYEPLHNFNVLGKIVPKEGVYLKFKIDGMKYPKRTAWMTLGYSPKSKLFSKYVSSLVEGAFKFMNYDLDRLLGMKVKMFWKNETGSDGKIYQNIEIIRPIESKLPLIEGTMTEAEKAALLETIDSVDFDPEKIEAMP